MDEAEAKAIVRECYASTQDAEINVHKFQHRLSTLWQISTRTSQTEEIFFLKESGLDQSMQASLCIDTEKLMMDCEFFSTLNTNYIARYDAIISRKSKYPSFQEQISTNIFPNLMNWYSKNKRIMDVSGKWLKHYHSFNRKYGSISEPLLRYIAPREYILDILPIELRKDFLRNVENCPDHHLVTAHSDFVPANIFSDGEKISVIDFGVNEWNVMSPYWDIVTLTIALDRYSLFSYRSPLRWIPSLQKALFGKFFSAYGDVENNNLRVWRICSAVRHFALLSAATKFNVSNAHVSWHLKRIGELIASDVE